MVGVGGAGMSAIASVLAAMGHTVTGSDLKSSPATSAPGGERGEGVRSGHDGAHVGQSRHGGGVDGHRRRPIPRSPRRVASASRSCRRAEVLAAIAACRRCVAVSGTHGKTTTTSMLALILVEAGLPAELSHRGRHQRDRHQRRVGQRASGWWSRPTRATAPFWPSIPRSPWSPTSRPTISISTGTSTHLVDAFDRFCAERPGGVVAGADDAVAAEIGPAPRSRHWWGRRPTPPTASSAVDRAGRRGLVRAAAPGTSPRVASTSPSPAPTSPATRRWRRWRPCAPGRRSMTRPAPWPGSPGVARRFELAGRGQRRAFRGRLRPSAHRGGGRDRGGRRDRTAPPRGGVPAASLQPDRCSVASSSPTPSSAPTWSS